MIDHLIDSVSMPLVVWSDKNLNPTEKILLTDIIGLIKKGKCFKGNQAFADLVGLSKDRVSKIISDLSKRGYLNVKLERTSSSNIEKRVIILSPKFRQILLGGLSLEEGSMGVESTKKERGGIVTDNHTPSCQQLGGIVTDNYNKKSLEEVNKESLISNPKSKDLGVQSELFIDDKPASLYKFCVDIWLKKIHPGWTFGAVHGQKMKSIISKLKQVSKNSGFNDDDNSISDLFLKMMNNLPEYYKDKDLQVIDSKFNEIITEIKNIKNGSKKSSRYDSIKSNLERIASGNG